MPDIASLFLGASMAMPLLTARGLHKTYRDGERLETVLAGVDLELFAGESVALLGRSGSGKSTLLNLLAGLDTVDSGEVRIAGQQMPVAERARSLLRRRHLGFVFQFFNLLGSLTVLENVALPLELNGTPAQRAADLALGKLDGVGLTALADAMPGRLSGGEQQRVAIARALVHEPDVLLADEPTGNLDADSGRALLGLLSGMLVGNRAILVATHSLAVAQFADRVLTLEDGRVAERSGDFAW